LNEAQIKEPLPSYSPSLCRITGGKGEAVALAQLIYKCAKSKWGTVRMSSTDWANEVQLTRREFENLNNCIAQLGLGTVEKCAIAMVKKMAYTLDKGAILAALKDTSVIYSTRTKQRIDTSEVTHRHVINNVSIGNKQRIDTSEIAHIKDVIKNKEDINKEFLFAEKNSAQFTPIETPDLFGAITGKPEQHKSPKPKKEKAPPAPPKHPHFTEFRNSYLEWYKGKFGMAHTFGAKEAGILATLIDRLKQVTEADEQTALVTFQAMLTNWDNLSKYNREKPQLNLLLSNLNSICTELKQNNDYDLDEQNWLLECDAKKGRHHADFTAYLKWYKLA
jgi:hypothetical protein